MIRQWICSDIGLGIWWCNFFGIYEVLDGVTKAHALINAIAMTLVEFAILRWVWVGQQVVELVVAG